MLLENNLSSIAAGKVFRDQPWAPEMVAIPTGTFIMGTDESDAASSSYDRPCRLVGVAAFACGRFPVTFDEWDRFASETNGYVPADQSWGRGRRPVINVSWNDAKAYVSWLNDKLDRSARRYRLLSEAEWEYVARAGTKSAFWWGSRADTNKANFNATQTKLTLSQRLFGGRIAEEAAVNESLLGSPGGCRGSTTNVDAFMPNPFGIYDLLGNVREWVEDECFDTYAGAPNDGRARQGGGIRGYDGTLLRVTRGGAWNHSASGIRCAARTTHLPADFRSYVDGFRVAKAF